MVVMAQDGRYKMQILQINNVSKSIRGKIIYEHISMDIHEGECYGIIGPDYSGKTSIIHTILGLMCADEGEIVWLGDKKNKKIMSGKVGYVPDDLLCFENMTGAELLDMTIKLGGGSIDDAEMLIDYFDINPSLRLDEMEEDMNKCTYFVSAFLREPKVLILDEPFNFLGEKSSIRLKNIIKSYIAAGNTVILADEGCEKNIDICTSFSAIRAGKQVRRDDKLEWYSPAKIIAVYGLDVQSKAARIKNMRDLIAVKLDKSESIFLYMGIDDIDGLKKIIKDLSCSDFTVKNLTIKEQIFMEYEQIKGHAAEGSGLIEI